MRKIQTPWFAEKMFRKIQYFWKIVSQNTDFFTCLRKIQYSWKIVTQNTDFFNCLRKLQYNRKNVPQNTESKNGYSANYSFLKIVLRILQFSQNTENNDLCYAKYRMKCYAKYNFFKRMLRKIQDIMLRKIQIYVKIVPQNTGKNCCV